MKTLEKKLENILNKKIAQEIENNKIGVVDEGKTEDFKNVFRSISDELQSIKDDIELYVTQIPNLSNTISKIEKLQVSVNGFNPI